jgi:PilZ domain-containing protein
VYTPTDRERRRGLRLPLEVRGRDAVGRSFRESTHSLNVSGGGICFESAQKLSIGARLELEIDLPTGLRRYFGGRTRYHAQALVCRVEHFEDETGYRVGARFLGEIGV